MGKFYLDRKSWILIKISRPFILIFIFTVLPLSMMSMENTYIVEYSGKVISETKEMSNQVVVSSTLELEQALNNASDGDVIILRDGVYDDLEIRNYNFDIPITIKSENHLGAEFANIELRNINGLRFDGIEINHVRTEDEFSTHRAFNIMGSQNIEIINSELHGTDDGNFNNDVFLLSARDSQNIFVSNSEFHNGIRGAVFQNVDNVRLVNNIVRDIRVDGFDFTETVNIHVEGNSFSNFYPDLEAGDHADAIQFFNQNNGNISTGNAVVTNNTFFLGEGDSFQSIFLRNTDPDVRFFNIEISDNIINTNNFHGITIIGARDINVFNNTVLSVPSATTNTTIYIEDTIGDVTVSKNLVSAIDIAGNVSGNISNNVIAQSDDPTLPTFLNNLIFDGFSGEEAVVEDFVPRPDGLLLQGGEVIGALGFEAAPVDLTARVTSETFYGTGDALNAEFSGNFSADQTGLLDDDEAEFTWDFGDGNTAEGLNVLHSYAAAGDYTVTLTVTRGGVSDTTTHTVTVRDPQLLSSDDLNRATDAVARSSSVVDQITSFDGSNAINLGRDPGLFGLNELYVGVDIRPTGDPSGDYRIFWNHSRYTIELDSGDLIFRLYTDDGEKYTIRVEDADVFDGEFHNVAISFDGNLDTFTAYVDGEVVGTINDITGQIDNVGFWDVAVGGDSFDNDRDFVGDLRNLEAYSSPEPVEGARNAVTVAVDTPTPEPEEPATTAPNTAPEGEQEAEPTDASYSLADDVSRNAELSGDARQNGDEFSFSGNGYINIGRPEEFGDNSEVAISFDIRADGETNAPQRVFWDTGRYGVEIKGDTVNFRLFTDEGEFISISVADSGITDGNYHSLAFTFDSDTGEFAAYINGTEVGRETGIEGDLRDANTSKDITIGGTSNGRGFDGDIKDFKLFDDVDVAVTELEIGGVVSAVASIQASANSTSDAGDASMSNVVPLNSVDTGRDVSGDFDEEADWATVAVGE